MFVSPTKGSLTLEEMVRDIVNYMQEDDRFHYRIIIGTDSQVSSPPNPSQHDLKGKQVDFVNAVVAHRKGKGGRYFWRRVHRQYHAPLPLKARMFTEANFSVELAMQLLGQLQFFLAEASMEYVPELEVHIDVGHNGPTREIIKELVSLVRSSGFEPRIKPDAYVASTVADKYA